MEKLVEFLTSKIGYTIAVIGGFLFPGLIFIFIWDKNLFINLNVVVLFTFAIAISFMLYIPNFILSIWAIELQEKMRKEKNEEKYFTILVLGLLATVTEMSGEMINKILNPSVTIGHVVLFVLGATLFLMAFELVQEVMYSCFRKWKGRVVKK